MTGLLINWLVSAILLMVVSRLVPGFEVHTFGTAMVAAVVIGLVNATLGALLKLFTLPLGVLTLGIFFIVINALMLKVAAALVHGFVIHGFAPAFWGALVLALLQMVVKWTVPERRR